MKELISMIPVFFLCLFIYFITGYWLKKDNEKNKDLLNNNFSMNFDKYINLKIMCGKIFSIGGIIILILKAIYIILAEYVF